MNFIAPIDFEAVKEERDQLESKLRIAIKALEFYARFDNYCDQHDPSYVARKALEEIKK